MENIAVASFGTRAAADSFMGWYRTWPVIDGKRNEISEEGRWGKVRWLSASTADPHWLLLLFPGTQRFERVELYWAQESGGFLRPREYRLQVFAGGSWVDVPELSRVDEERRSVIALPPTESDRLRVFMPAGAGPESRPTVLGIAEFEVYAAEPRRGAPNPAVVLQPAAESRANPFWLNWTPSPGATGYLVQYSLDGTFQGDVTEQAVLENWHMPAAPLEPGDWYWRVAPVLPEGTGEWSEPSLMKLTGAFTFTPALTGSWRSEHPRLPAGAIDRSRFLKEAQGDKAQLWARIQEVLAGPVEHVAQIRNMQDSAPAQGPGALPAEPPGFDDAYWTIERWREIVAAGAKVLEVLTLSSFAYALSGEETYRDLARRWLLHASQWNPEGSTGIESVDHAAHDVLVGLATAYDALYHDLTPSERDTVRTAIAGRCAALYRYLNPFENDPNNNHPWFQTTGLAFGALAIWDEVPEARTWARFATEIYVARYLCLGGIDGEWHEGSDYWTYGLGFVFDFCDAVKSVTGLDLYRHPWLEKTARFKLYVAPPKGPGLSFGDTHNHPPGGEDAAQMFCLASAHRDPYAQWYALQALAASDPKRPGLLLRLFLWWDPSVPAKAPSDLPPSALFREAGWALLHTTLEHQQGIHFALHSGHFYGVGGGHSHADQNTFLLFAGGEPLVLDSGCYDYYGSPHFNGWYIHTKAHNTLMVDGQGQAVQMAGAHGAVTRFESTADYDYLCGDASNPVVYQGRVNRFLRHVLFLRKLGCFVLIDEVQTPAPASLDWLLHTPAAPDLRYEDGMLRATVRRPGASLELYMPEPGALTWEVTESFPEGLMPTKPHRAEFHLRLNHAASSTQTRFVTVLAPVLPGEAAPTVTWETGRLTVRSALGSATIAHDWGNAPIVTEVGL